MLWLWNTWALHSTVQQEKFKLEQGCNTINTQIIKKSNDNNTCNPNPNINSKQLIVTAYVSNKPFNMFLDTGAGASLISTRIIHQLNMLENIQPTATIIKGLSNMKLLTKGEIYLNKNNLKLNSPLDAKKNDIGMVFQHFNLFETLSVFENLIIDSDEQRESLREKIDSIMKKHEVIVNRCLDKEKKEKKENIEF